jgi:hypothetical protein
MRCKRGLGRHSAWLLLLVRSGATCTLRWPHLAAGTPGHQCEIGRPVGCRKLNWRLPHMDAAMRPKSHENRPRAFFCGNSAGRLRSFRGDRGAGRGQPRLQTGQRCVQSGNREPLKPFSVNWRKALARGQGLALPSRRGHRRNRQPEGVRGSPRLLRGALPRMRSAHAGFEPTVPGALAAERRVSRHPVVTRPWRRQEPGWRPAISQPLDQRTSVGAPERNVITIPGPLGYASFGHQTSNVSSSSKLR